MGRRLYDKYFGNNCGWKSVVPWIFHESVSFLSVCLSHSLNRTGCVATDPYTKTADSQEHNNDTFVVLLKTKGITNLQVPSKKVLFNRYNKLWGNVISGHVFSTYVIAGSRGTRVCSLLHISLCPFILLYFNRSGNPCTRRPDGRYYVGSTSIVLITPRFFSIQQSWTYPFYATLAVVAESLIVWENQVSQSRWTIVAANQPVGDAVDRMRMHCGFLGKRWKRDPVDSLDRRRVPR